MESLRPFVSAYASAMATRTLGRLRFTGSLIAFPRLALGLGGALVFAGRLALGLGLVMRGTCAWIQRKSTQTCATFAFLFALSAEKDQTLRNE